MASGDVTGTQCVHPVQFDEVRWIVGHVCSRAEKRLAGDLQRHNITLYLPLCNRTNVWHGHRRLFEVPLFPGYIFLDADKIGEITLLNKRRIVSLIKVPDQSKLARELQAVRLALASSIVTPFNEMTKGTEVEVVRGPLRGQRGTVISCDGKSRLILSVSMLGQSVSLEIDPGDVEVV